MHCANYNVKPPHVHSWLGAQHTGSVCNWHSTFHTCTHNLTWQPQESLAIGCRWQQKPHTEHLSLVALIPVPQCQPNQQQGTIDQLNFSISQLLHMAKKKLLDSKLGGRYIQNHKSPFVMECGTPIANPAGSQRPWTNSSNPNGVHTDMLGLCAHSLIAGQPSRAGRVRGAELGPVYAEKVQAC